MTDVPLHRLYRHYSELPYSQRVLYTATLIVLGMGYLFALINLWHTYAGRAGGSPMMLTVDDLVVVYTGSGKGSRLEAALRGPMSRMLPADEVTTVIAWVDAGADRAKYEADIRPLLEKRCMACHDGSNPHLPNLSNYEGLRKVTERDTGTDIFTLVRVSHIHFFGVTFIFFIMGLMYSHAYVRPVWFKCAIVALPFVALLLDISSWYFTKLYHPFAWVVIFAGGIMGMCFAFMWFTTMYQLWFSRTPSAVAQREDRDAPPSR
jgi:hypothetical protein